jgi:hypothetical protein
LIYECTTIFDCGLSLDFLEHDCTFHPAFPWPPLKAIIFFWIANVNLRRPYDGNDPGHSLFEVLGRRFAYSRRQLLANAAIAASRVGS